jgi:hypothetical protein
MSLVPITSLDELKKVLAIQDTIAKQAQKEIMAAAEGGMADFVENAKRVLEKYARYPTLTEYQRIPHLADAEKWGATFGVTAVLAILVLDHARAFLGRLPKNVHVLYLQFLEKLRDRHAKTIVMDDLTKAFAVLSEAYGVCWTEGESLSLTVTGSRVLLHVLDSEIFVDETAKQIADLMASENPS